LEGEITVQEPTGPGTPYQLLFSEVAGQPSLPETFRHIYPGDWQIPLISGRPYIYTNFAQSRDGRISFNAPGHVGGGPVTNCNPHDRWLMALLRMRADAVLVGDRVVNLEYEHLWTAETICPTDAQAFAAQRRAEGYAAMPLLVILTYDGEIDEQAHCLACEELRIVVATTTKGAANFRQRRHAAQIDVLDLGEQAADLRRLARILHDDYGVRNLLCEGGAIVLAQMLDAGLVDEEFVTLCPTFIGRTQDRFRPSYTEGIAWLPDNAPYSQPLSLHRAGDFLFMRTRCRYPGQP
jgi:5-amino-6-(5-phosphoribosylamino)uracil reductase